MRRRAAGERGTARLKGGRVGFTFIEVIVVLAVIGILATLVLPYLPLARYRMDGAVRGVALVLVSAQRQAVKRQRDVVVSFDTATGTVYVHEDSNGNGQVDTGEPLRAFTLDDGVTFGRGGAPARPMGTASVTFTGRESGRPEVTFYRNGSTDEQGGLYLTTKQAMANPGHENHARAIEVERATGRVSWYYFNTTVDSWSRGF
ncbi:MAG: type II secretion system protein [Gemmatimonadota bacterium]|jgi:prepilin-type N-terminal cleavage/methylation domain-containing protein